MMILVYNIIIAESVKNEIKITLCVIPQQKGIITAAAKKIKLRIKTFLLNLAFIAYIIIFPNKEKRKVIPKTKGRTDIKSQAHPTVLFIP